MKCRLAEQEVEEGGIVGLDDEEEDFLCWDSKERGSNDHVGRICPYPRMDQVRIPRCGRDDGNLNRVSRASRSCRVAYCNEEEDLVETKTRKQRLVAERQSYRRRYRILEVSADQKSDWAELMLYVTYTKA